MSLINRMLEDLEHRHGEAPGAAPVFAGLAPAEPEGLSRRALPWFALPSAFALVVVASVWQGTAFQEPDRPRASATADAGAATALGLLATPAAAAMREAMSGLRPGAPSATRAGPAGAEPTLASLRLSLDLAEAPVAPAPATARVLETDPEPLLDPELVAEARRINRDLASNPPAAGAPAAGLADDVDAALANAVDAAAQTAARRAPAAGEVRIDRAPAPAGSAAQADARYRQALAALRAGDPDSAAAELQAALALAPAHHAAREALAGLMHRAGAADAAVELLAAGLAQDPGAHRLAKLYARMLVDLGRAQSALQSLERHAPAIAEDPEYHAFAAALLQRTEQHERAVQRYRAVLARAPGQGVWWMGLAISLEATGQADQAIDSYLRARRSGRLSPEVARFVDQRLELLAGTH